MPVVDCERIVGGRSISCQASMLSKIQGQRDTDRETVSQLERGRISGRRRMRVCLDAETPPFDGGKEIFVSIKEMCDVRVWYRNT